VWDMAMFNILCIFLFVHYFVLLARAPDLKDFCLLQFLSVCRLSNPLLVCIRFISTQWVKKQDISFMSITLRNINRFSKFVNARISTKSATKLSLHIELHLRDNAAFLWETPMFQKLHKLKNTVLVFINKILLKLVKESRFLLKMCVKKRIRVISVGIKYFIHDKLCDVIKYCAWRCGSKINAHNKIVTENLKKIKYGNWRSCSSCTVMDVTN